MSPLKPRFALGSAALTGLVTGWVLTLSGCSRSESTKLEQTPPPHVRVVEVELAQPRPASQHLVPLQAFRRARLAPRQGGEVIELLVDEEQRVEEGEVLVRFAGDDPRGGLISAKASIERIEEALRDNDRELQAAQTLLSQGVETARGVERLQTQRISLQAQLREARGQLVRAKDRVGATAILASFAGTIVSVDTEVGEYMAPGQVAVVLAQLDPIALEVPLTQDEVTLADAGGLSYRVEARGQSHVPKLEWLASEASAGTNTFTARLQMPNPDGKLRAGELVEVDVLAAAREPVMVVPGTAVRWAAGQAYVLELQGQSVARVDVRVGDDIEDRVVVQGDLQPGDRVVSSGPVALLPGDQVEVVEGQPDALAASQ